MKNKTINKLPQSIITRIAAGQVVERPVSVVKELIENSIDADATQIDINVTKGGIKKISVSDNGSGMSPDDLKMSFLPHTTSKISSIADLANIKSLGFRGEALASIVSMATVTIQSRRPHDVFGYEYTISRSKILHDSKVGMQSGTVVEVSQLFASHPARKNQIKSKRSELKLIIDTVEQASLAHPSIGFRLVSDGKIIIDLESEKMSQRIQAVLSKGTKDNLIHFRTVKPHLSVTGYIGLPQIASVRNTNYVFVNERPVVSGSLSSAIKRAYGTLLESRQFPFFILFISLPESLVDVNIHPQKTIVRTSQDHYLEELIVHKVTSILNKQNLVQTISSSTIAKFNKHISTIVTTHTSAWDARDLKSEELSVMQFDKVYLLAKTKNEIFLIDQHAAHERILFNQYRSEFDNLTKNPRTTKLVEPQLLEFSALNHKNILDAAKFLRRLGFEYDDFGNNTIQLHTIPRLFEGNDYGFLLTELSSGKLEDTYFRTIATIACKAAIKDGDVLSSEESVTLITKLLKEKEFTTCPHGRPTLLTLTRKQLDTMFKRS